jgi:hypothetical protein
MGSVARAQHQVSPCVRERACEHLPDWCEKRWALVALDEEDRRGELLLEIEIDAKRVGVAQLAKERRRVSHGNVLHFWWKLRPHARP